jgi:glycosyltransferase involved in cell wall biosynthesis
MKKICMVVYHYYYRDSRLRRYAEGLAGAGVPVDVLCLREQGQPPAGQIDHLRLYTVPAIRSSGGVGRFALAYALALITFSVWLLALHVRRRYQVIHVHNMPDSLVLCALLPRLLGAKVILDIHDPMPEFYASKFQARPDGKAVRLLRLHERLSAALAHAVITANPNFRDNLAQRGIPAEKITVINNLPDPAIFARSQAPTRSADRRAFTLIYPGTIAPRYGLEVAIQALSLLTEQAPGIRLILLGSAQPAYRQALAELAERLGAAAQVEFRPPVPVDQVPAHLAQADVGIYPALPDPHMQIATPSKVLEYAALGLPIVASRLKVLEDLFGDAAILFCEPGNAQEFAACILELYQNPARGEELARQARWVVSDAHAWPQEQRKYFALLGKLTGSPLARAATEEAS